MSTTNLPVSNDAAKPGPRDLQAVRPPAPEFLAVRIARILERRKWTIIAALVALPLLTLIAIARITPLYTAYETVIYEPKRPNVIDLQKVLQPELIDSTIESQIEIIKSRDSAQQVVDALGLVLRPEFNAALEHSRLADAEDTLSARVYRSIFGILGFSPVRPPRAGEENDRAANEAVVQRVLSRLDIESKGRSSAIEIRFTSEDPALARDAAAKFANLYIDNQLELKFQSMKRASDWLSVRLDQLRQQADASQRAFEDFRGRTGLTDAARTAAAANSASGMSKDLLDAQTTLAAAQANLEAIRAFARAPVRLESIPPVLDSTTIDELLGRESALLARETELAARVGERHPDLVELRTQIARLRDQIFEEVGRVATKFENDVRAADARVNTLKNGLQRAQGTVTPANAAVVRLRELEREARADQDLLQTFLGRSKEITQQYDIEEPDARVLSPAYSSTEPTFPKTSLYIGVALAAGLILGLTLAYLEEQLDQTFRSSEEVENALNIPALAVPRFDKPNWRMPFFDYVLAKPSSIFAESIRSLRNLLWLTDLQSRAKLIAVTSSRRGEGKTTTAVSLGRVAALSGERALVIDCDLTHPTIHLAFRQPSADVGLTDLLTGQAGRREATKADKNQPNLHYITAGTRSEKLNDLLRSENMIALLREARNEYDLVVIDTPPTLGVANGRVLATLCDAVVYCIGWRSTARAAAIAGINALTGVGANLRCAALTQVTLRSAGSRERNGRKAYAAGHTPRTASPGDTTTARPG